MKKIAILLGFILAFNAYSKPIESLPLESCADELTYGKPLTGKKSTTVLCRRAYALEYDNNAKIPIWVSYTLTPEHSTGCLPRKNKYSADTILGAYAASLKDYAKSEYDMGHMANDADMRWDAQAQAETYLLSNIAPQSPKFNRGIWKRLEDNTRGWALSRNHKLQIYVGPIYGKNDSFIGANMVVVPHSFYKAIIDTETKNVMIFVMPNIESKDRLNQYITSLAELQKLTNVTFPMPEHAIFSRKPWTIKLKTAVALKRQICN